MKAAAFDYVRAGSLAESIALLSKHGGEAKLIAGGQSLLPALNLRLMAPSILIDIGRLDELRGISVSNNLVRIGALTRHVELQRSPVIAKYAPLLAMAAPHVAHPAIRNRGTLGGNLAYADPASELPACLLALNAQFSVRGPGGERKIAANDFFTGLFATSLAPDEVLTAVEFAAAQPEDRFAFDELSRRKGDYAMAGLACCGRFSGGKFSALTLAFFSVGDRPLLAAKAAALLTGRPIAEPIIAEAQAALAACLEPQDDPQASAATRLQWSRVLLKRALVAMTKALTGSESA
jgi:aerobic carbon-monoxide dehydrogenase medium subunit